MDFPEVEKKIRGWKSASDTYLPDAVLLNVGIHTMIRTDAKNRAYMESFIDYADSMSPPLKYFLHSCTPLKAPATQNNTVVVKFNELTKSIIPKWKSLVAYLDFYDYALVLQELSGSQSTCIHGELTGSFAKCSCKRHDGMYFDRVCNYAPLMSQWDFNWLLTQNIISYNPPSA